ncbi:hypothetical protein GIB67_030280 [Kingdonia uniflora]|uniref:Threonylcarbamoyl-AMP synthase n=1 Tax=Kingdonia uniflora TaxID=39325 RepID=A0A7J7M6H2_9MAGN|nr:hypothetical protein GIB67_030280 [Kingdonia uniflora]
MNFPAKIAELSGIRLAQSSSLKGLPKLQCYQYLHHKRRFAGIIGLKEITWNLSRCDFYGDIRAGAILPADELRVEEAIGAIKDGKVIAVPTDTLYGFTCDACSTEAVHKIYEIKGRNQTSPLAICVGDVSDIKRFAVTDHLPHGLLNDLLPGPVTVVLRRGEHSTLERSLNPGLDSIGVRVPDSKFIRAVAHGSESALALTSANLSGKRSSVSIKDFECLWEHCAYVYDGGLLPSGRSGSTIVDLIKLGKYKILRPGSALKETVVILHKYSLQEELEDAP